MEMHAPTCWPQAWSSGVSHPVLEEWASGYCDRAHSSVANALKRKDSAGERSVRGERAAKLRHMCEGGSAAAASGGGS